MSNTTTLAAELSNIVQAIANCEASGNEEWGAKHRARLRALCDRYLHTGTFLPEKSGAECLVFSHVQGHYDDVGYYDGTTSHVIRARPSFLYGCTLTISGPDRNGFKEIIGDAVHRDLMRSIAHDELTAVYPAADVKGAP